MEEAIGMPGKQQREDGLWMTVKFREQSRTIAHLVQRACSWLHWCVNSTRKLSRVCKAKRKMGQRLTNEEGEQVEIDAAEMQELYKKFVVECPSGTLFMHEFKQFFGVQNNQEAGDYVENMFKAFDKNGDNTIDFLEYVAALNLVLRGKLEHKLRWTFKMYDKDGNGCIDKAELLEIVECIYKLKKVCQPEEDAGHPHLSPEEVVDRIFQLVDENGDEQLSLDEFLDGAQKDNWVMKMLHVDMNAGVWISDQKRKSDTF